MNALAEYVGVVWSGLTYVWQRVWHILQAVIQWIGKSEILKDVFSLLVSFASGCWDIIKGIADQLTWIFDNIIMPVLNGIEAAYKWIKGLTGGSVDVNVKTPKTTSSSSLTATQAAGSTDAGLTPTQPTKTEGDPLAKGITSGGPRIINISIGKMVEKIEMHVGDVKDGLQDMEHKVEEVFLRVLNSGASIQNQ